MVYIIAIGINVGHHEVGVISASICNTSTHFTVELMTCMIVNIELDGMPNTGHGQRRVLVGDLAALLVQPGHNGNSVITVTH